MFKMLPERLKAGEGPGEIGTGIPQEFKDIIDKCGSLKQENRPEIKQVSKDLNSLYTLYLKHGRDNSYYPSSSSF